MSKLDFQDIKGQEHVKRALEVAVTGGHNVLLISPSMKEVNRFVTRIHTIADKENLIATYSMTACPCGNFTNPKKECHCTPTQIQKHLSQFPQEILDVIDIHIEVPVLNQKVLTDKRKGEPSKDIKARADKARFFLSSKKEFLFDKEANELLKLAILELGLSAKCYDKVIRVATTIAKMDGKAIIEAHHISESISYRSLDRCLWG
jgi:magnesium chelatase family protein